MKLNVSLFLLLIVNVLLGQSVNNQETHQYDIKRTSADIKVDGVLDEEVWNETAAVGDFWYSFPVDDKAVEEEFQTEVKITYDDRFIYVSAKCKGHGPFLMPTLKRDSEMFWSGDVFSIVFDPINEKTNGANFGTNPAGVQFDVLIGANTGTRSGGGGGGFNVAWDNKWTSNSKEYGDYWTTEMAIPFNILKYGDSKTWGFNLLRGVPETNSWQTWAPVPVHF